MTGLGGGLCEVSLYGLSELCGKYRERDVIIVSDTEWATLLMFVSSFQVVAATPERPAFFWFRDKKIVTPSYVLSQKTAGSASAMEPVDPQLLTCRYGTHAIAAHAHPGHQDCPGA